MLKKSFIIFSVASFIFSSSLFGLSLKESVVEVLNTNPVIQERLKNFRATQQDLNIANSEYYPQLDFRAVVGFNKAGALKNGDNSDYSHNIVEQDYGNYETSLTFTQNLFDGFGTTHKVNYEEARILASAYNYIEKSNDIAFKMIDAYVNVMRSHELTQTARENVQINENIYKKVKDLFESGLTTDSEVKKIQSSLSLARSNLTVQKNNARDAEYSFRRVLGRMPLVHEMQRPEFNVGMPESIQRAAMYSVEHNPSLLVSRYNIKGAQELYKQHKKDYYPKIDFEMSQFYNDVEKRNAFDSPDDRFRARLVLNYNIFRGGADKANIQKHLSKINQEIEIKRDLKRQVIEGLNLSWNAYQMIGEQLKDLRDYSSFSESTLSLYEEEYDLGRRSLLDLLASQNDVINSRSQIIKAEYDQLFAKYRILDAMGLLVTAVTGDVNKHAAKVNLYSGSEALEILDTLPVKLDSDNDEIPDNIDLCDNSLKANNIMPYGCKKMMRDSDSDGVIDAKDSCPLTPINAKVSPDGCALDSDFDGVKDYADKCPKTPIGYTVDEKGCTISLSLRVNFSASSSNIPSDSKTEIDVLAGFLKANLDYNVHIIGHTNNIGDASANLKLSDSRSKAIKKALQNQGVNTQRLSSEGRGEEEPIASNETAEGLNLNRRVDIELSKTSEEI
ncbi:TolC family outer membrane protein [Sulfurimonas sp.]|uniref:TolC family outer membrane protein n=1 Tax=Sulfurimonas sp. TaxID=2022749 RepID=UPI002AAF4C8D|nr:TolC family outer membrane protein [Sulfurimonas sp.]